MPTVAISSVITMLASGTADATYYSGWDKVGAVAVCVLMLGVLVLLHRAGLRRVDKISDKHIEFVEKQTQVLSTLATSCQQVVKITDSFHRRLDWMLRCRKNGCPVNALLSQEVDDVAGHQPLAGPQGPLP